MRIYGLMMAQFYLIYFVWIGIFVLTVRAFLDENEGAVSREFVLLSLIILIGTRLVFLGISPKLSIDTLWYLDFGKFMMQNKIPYAEFYFPYPPFFAYVIYLVMLIAPIPDAFRVIAIAADAGSLLVLRKISESRLNSDHTRAMLIAFALLPMGIIESGANGHFEALVNLIMLLALYAFLKKQFMTSGIGLGVATSIKLYPAFLLIPMLAFARNHRERRDIFFAAVTGYVVAGAPIMILAWVSGGALLPVYIPLLSLTILPVDLLPVFFIGMVFAFAAIEQPRLQPREKWAGIRRFIHLFNDLITKRSLTILTGVMFILLGIYSIAAPFLPKNNWSYWRFAIDSSSLRGGIGVIIGMIIVHIGLKTRGESSESDEGWKIVHLGIVILLSIIGIQFIGDYYGWYLLWVMPLIILISDRRLFLLALTCTLILYPAYTYDNFASLGFDEPHTWSDETPQPVGWSAYLNLTAAPSVHADQISVGIRQDSNRAVFWCNTTQIQNISIVQNISVIFWKNVSIPLTEDTEFVTEIGCNWDPTFVDEKYAFVAITGEGKLANGTMTSFDILGLSGSLSNLTQLHWRRLMAPIYSRGVVEITGIQLKIYPRLPQFVEVYLGYIYTTTRQVGSPYTGWYALLGVWLVAVIAVMYDWRSERSLKRMRE